MEECYYYVYIATNKTNKVLYTGVTNNIYNRQNQHKTKLHPKSFTAKYNASKIVHYETYNNSYDAITREKQIKGWTREKKLNLIRKNNPGWKELTREYYSNMRKVVGAIIKNKDNKILLLDRVNIPYGWAGPAGHVDKGETLEQSIIRETKEEVGLDLINFKLIFHEAVPWNNCRKHNGHDWYVYEVTKWQGELIPPGEEAKEIRWFTVDEIKQIKLEPVWQYWFKKLNFI